MSLRPVLVHCGVPIAAFAVFLAAVSAEDAALMTAPSKLYVGGDSSVTILSVDASSGTNQDQSLTLELIAPDESATLLFEGRTGLGGRRRVQFSVPEVPTGAYRLRAFVGEQVLESSATVTSTPALLIETDKPVYRPGQRILGRVVRLSNQLRPDAGQVEITFFDGKGIRVARQQLEANEFGVAAFSLELASELNTGTWRLRAASDDAESLRDLTVDHYVLPRFEILVDLERDWALVSEAVSGAILADYFFGQPVQGTVRVVASRWVGLWEEYADIDGHLIDGRLEFTLPAVQFVTGTPQTGGLGSIRIDVSVTDSTGHSQTATESITVAQSDVVLGLQALRENLKGGLPVQVLVTAEDPGGTPLEATVDLRAEFFDQYGDPINFLRESVTIQRGAAVWAVTPPMGSIFADIEATLAGSQNAPTLIRLAGTYSPSENFLNLVRVDGTFPPTIGQSPRFRVDSTQGTPVYFEVYAGGRTVFSDVTETNTFSFPVTVAMIPSARVVAYQLTDSNELLADRTTLETRLSISTSFAAGFETDTVKPGDPVTVTIDTGLEQPVLLGLSIVDESVLSLGRSRLHLEEVFEELENRFLEPVAQIVDDGPGLPIGLGVPFGESFRVQGTRDVFEEAGLLVVSTPNLTIPQGQDFGFLEDAVPSSPPAGTGTQGVPAEMPRVRQFFPETWHWNPLLMTDANGQATLALTAPDSITGWKLAAVATFADAEPGEPGIAFAEADLTVFQDFFIEPLFPVSVVRGESFPLRVSVFNYLDVPQTLELSISGAEGLEFLEPGPIQLTVEANTATGAEFRVRPVVLGDLPLQVTAIGVSGSDAVLRELRVVPEGHPTERVTNGLLEPDSTTVLNICIEGCSDASLPPSPAVVPGSGRAFLAITPSPVAQTMEGVEELLHLPFGCGEQNMIFLAPDIEILKYLRAIGELSPEIRAKAESFINTGYQRQLTFQTDDGGFAAFGGPTGSLWLTAFVLSTFSGAREVRDIDEGVLADAAAMLVSRQKVDGSFETDPFLIHTEMAGGAANEFAMTAYVTNALAEYGGAEVAAALEKAADYLNLHRTLLPEVNNHAYALAIAAVSLQQIPGFEFAAESVLDRLLELAIVEGVTIHWEPFAVETTGYAAIALLKGVRQEAGAALDWLTTQRNSLGGYGTSTQDTVVALRALFQAVQQVNRDLNARIEVIDDGHPLLDVLINETNFDLLHQVELPVDGTAIEVRATGQGTISYQVTERFNVPGDVLPPPKDMLLEVFYDTEHVSVDDLVDVIVTAEYRGSKDRTAMVIADIGVPTGFEAVPRSLENLLEMGIVERAETAGRKVIFYLDTLSPFEPVSFTFQVRALYPIRPEPVVSQVYEYYDPAIRAFHAFEPPQIVVSGAAPPSIRDVSAGEAPGGTRLTITGSGFLSGALLVLFNGVAGIDIEILDDNTLLVTLPNLEPGPVEIEIITDGGSAFVDSSSGQLRVVPLTLYYPLYPSSQGRFTGFSFSNFSQRPARLKIGSFRSDGTPIIETAPMLIDLAAGRQLARLGRELFPDSDSQTGWVRLDVGNSEISSVFQFGDAGSLDGASPFQGTATRFWFNRAYEGPRSYYGQPASTVLTLINPTTAETTAVMTLLSQDGSVLRSTEWTLGPGQARTDSTRTLFDMTEIPRGAYLRVDASNPEGIAGFARVEVLDGQTTFGLTASVESESRVSFSAQAVSAKGIRTSFAYVNSGDSTRRIQLRLFETTGSLVASRELDLAPGQSLQDDLASLFSLSEETEIIGSVVVEADGPGILGDAVFGDPQGHSAAALPMQRHAFKRAIFSHWGDTIDFFTGLALFNTSEKPTAVRVRAFQPGGDLVGEATIELGPWARDAKLLREWIAAVAGQLGGFIVVESPQPLASQLLFGDSALARLSAVPPTISR